MDPSWISLKLSWEFQGSSLYEKFAVAETYKTETVGVDKR